MVLSGRGEYPKEPVGSHRLSILPHLGQFFDESPPAVLASVRQIEGVVLLIMTWDKTPGYVAIAFRF